jgi:hypothetical protein
MGELGQTAWDPSLLRFSWLPHPPSLTPAPSSGIKPKSSRKTKFWGLFLTSVFWNSATALACYYFYDNWKRGVGQGCFWIALCVVCPIGLMLMIETFKRFLILFNPTPIVAMNSLEVPSGGSMNFGWTMKGRVESIKHLKIQLVGKEITKFLQGTDVQTDEHVFTSLQVYESSNEVEIRQGNIVVNVPKDAIHSFDSGSNKIQWTLKVRGSISRWPDLEEEYEIVVRPFHRSEITFEN